MNQLDFITYGNPFDVFIPYLKEDKGFDFLLKELKEYPFPPNSSEATKDEIRELLAYQSSHHQKNEKLIHRFLAYDEDLAKMLKLYCNEKLEIKEDELIDELLESTRSLIAKLKFHYNRPRPYQMAQYLKARLFPSTSLSAQSPSYPSGHTIQSKVICGLLANKYPQHNEALEKLAHDIALSRLYLGLHFPSDNDFGIIVADAITTSKQFNEKYGI